jgi:hypothetical protein
MSRRAAADREGMTGCDRRQSSILRSKSRDMASETRSPSESSFFMEPHSYATGESSTHNGY